MAYNFATATTAGLLLNLYDQIRAVEEEFRIRRKNRQMMLSMMCMNQMKKQNGRRRRTAWVWPRPRNWFRTLMESPAIKFMRREHMRVTRKSFEFICDLVRLNLQKQHSKFKAPASVQEIVGLALRRLATGNSYRSCRLQFGLAKSTAKIICSEFKQAILDLKNRFIRFPLTSNEI